MAPNYAVNNLSRHPSLPRCIQWDPVPEATCYKVRFFNPQNKLRAIISKELTAADPFIDLDQLEMTGDFRPKYNGVYEISVWAMLPGKVEGPPSEKKFFFQTGQSLVVEPFPTLQLPPPAADEKPAIPKLAIEKIRSGLPVPADKDRATEKRPTKPTAGRLVLRIGFLSWKLAGAGLAIVAVIAAGIAWVPTKKLAAHRFTPKPTPRPAKLARATIPPRSSAPADKPALRVADAQINTNAVATTVGGTNFNMTMISADSTVVTKPMVQILNFGSIIVRP